MAKKAKKKKAKKKNYISSLSGRRYLKSVALSWRLDTSSRLLFARYEF